MARLDVFTLKSGQRRVGDSFLKRGQSITLPHGSDQAKKFRRDTKTWSVTTITGGEPKRPNLLKAIGKGASKVFTDLSHALSGIRDAIGGLDDDERQALARMIHGNREKLGEHLDAVLTPAGIPFAQSLEAISDKAIEAALDTVESGVDAGLGLENPDGDPDGDPASSADAPDANALRLLALESFQAILSDPDALKMGDLLEAAEKAGLAISDEVRGIKRRDQLVEALTNLLLEAFEAFTPKTDPEDPTSNPSAADLAE